MSRRSDMGLLGALLFMGASRDFPIMSREERAEEERRKRGNLELRRLKIVEEYLLIKDKKSGLSRKERDWYVAEVESKGLIEKVLESISGIEGEKAEELRMKLNAIIT